MIPRLPKIAIWLLDPTGTPPARQPRQGRSKLPGRRQSPRCGGTHGFPLARFQAGLSDQWPLPQTLLLLIPAWPPPAPPANPNALLLGPYTELCALNAPDSAAVPHCAVGAAVPYVPGLAGAARAGAAITPRTSAPVVPSHITSRRARPFIIVSSTAFGACSLTVRASTPENETDTTFNQGHRQGLWTGNPTGAATDPTSVQLSGAPIVAAPVNPFTTQRLKITVT